MALDIGALSLGVETRLAALDALDARLAAYDRMPHMVRVGIDTSGIQAGFGGQFQQQMQQAAASTKVVSQELVAASASAKVLETNFNGAGASAKLLEGNVKGAATSLLGMTATTVGVLAVGAAFVVAAKSAEQLQQNMANLEAVGHFSPKGLSDLTAAIQVSAQATVFTTSQIAQADTILAKSGADVNSIMKEQVDVLNLASAANTSATEASSAMVAAQKSFGLTAKDSTDIANVLAQAVDSSVGTFNDMTDALKQVGPVAMQAGLSLRDTTTAIAALENAGLQGDTGTGLKIFLQRLEAPTAQAKTAIHDLGLEVYDANGKMKSLADIADQLRLKTIGLSDEAKNTDLTQIFGARGVRVADVFSSQGSDGLQAVTEHEAELGTAADIAQTKLATLSGQMKELKSSADTVAANAGGVLIPALSAAGSEFTDLLNSVTKLTGGLSDLGGAGKYGQQIASSISAATTAPIGDQPFTRDEQRINLLREQKDLQDQIAKLQPDVDASKGDILGHLLGDDGGKAQLDQAKEGLRQVNAEIAKLDPAALASKGLQSLSQQEADLANEFSHGRTTMDAAMVSAKAWADTAILMGANTATVTNSLQDFQVALKNVQNAQDEQRYIELKTMQDERDRARDLLDKGAPPSLVENAVFGKGAGIDKGLLVEQEAELKKWETTYAQVQKDGAQALSDAYKLQHQQVQDLATAQIDAATKSADAWKAAGSAIGQVSSAKDFSGIAATAEGLDKARAALADLGQSNSHLDALTAIVDKFNDIKVAEQAAGQAFAGYMLTLTESQKKSGELDAIKQQFLSQVDAAQQRQLRGTANDADNQLVANQKSLLANITGQQSGLSQNQSADILGIVTHLQDYVDADNRMRAAVSSLGGGQSVIGQIQAQVALAEQDVTALEKKDRQTTIKVKADTTEALRTIDEAAKAASADRTMHVQVVYGYPDGKPAGPPAPPGGSAGGGALGFAALSADQYNQIVPAGSPLHNDASYQALIQAAQSQNIDPRVLLTLAQQESQYGTSGIASSARAIGGRNDVGLTYSGSFEGEYKDPSVSNGQGDFAVFHNDLQEFIAAAKNIQTGPYKDAFASGDPTALFKTWDGSGVDKAVILNQMRQTYPATPWDATRGYGAPITKGTGYGPGDVALGSGQTPTGGYAPGATGARQDIVNAAMKDIGLQDFVDQCEKWVEEKIQQATGQRGATGVNEQNATLAYQHAAAMGLERPANQAPQAGDLVYYPDANGGPGHVALYKGQGEQISTWDKGDPNNPANAAIHREAIGPGAHFIMVPGTQSDTTRPNNAATSGIPGQANVPGAPPPSLQSIEELARALYGVDQKGADLKKTLSNLTPKDFGATIAQFNTLAPILDKMAHKGDTADTSQTTKIEESAAALAKNLDLTRLWGAALSEMHAPTGQLVADIEKVRQAGGEIGNNLASQLQIMQSQAAIADRIAQLTQRKTDLEAAQAAAQQTRQQQDTAESRAMTRQGYADQDADTALANRGRVENASYTTTQRNEEDRSRALAFSQQVGATDLQNQLADLQKSQQSTIYQRTSQEQLLSAQSAGAGTNQQAAVLAANLAAMHDQDLLQKDANTRDIDAIQLKIREQAKQANLDSYNLETERIQKQREHENILQGITDEGVANTATRQARDRAHQQELFDIQDARTAEDAKSTAAIAAIDAEITAQQGLATAAADNLKAAQDALTIWQQTGVDVGLAGTGIDALSLKLINAAQQAAYYASASGLKTASGVPYNQFPAPGASRYAGGTNGYVTSGIVGDTASGDLSNAEWVEGRFKVYSHADSVRMGKINGASPRYAGGTAKPIPPASPASSGGGGTTVNLNLGDVALMLSEQDKTEIRRFVQAKIDAARKDGLTRKGALGIR